MAINIVQIQSILISIKIGFIKLTDDIEFFEIFQE